MYTFMYTVIWLKYVGGRISVLRAEHVSLPPVCALCLRGSVTFQPHVVDVVAITGYNRKYGPTIRFNPDVRCVCAL